MESKIHGDPEIFATQYEMDVNHGGSWLFGKFCYWIKGEQIGNYDDGTSLRDIFFLLNRVVKDTRKFCHTRLSKASTQEIYNLLSRALYTPSTEYDDIAVEECWARFEIGLPVDVFDGWHIFLLEDDSEAKIIYSKFNNNIMELKLPTGFFDKVIEDTYTSIQKIYEKQQFG
jgi:hypothetical protein